MERRLITSALPYVNNVPHLGNIIGCVLSADVFSRFSKLNGYDTLYVCGTDEHGTATETKAAEENMTPKQICDKYHDIHKKIYDWFSIEFDAWGRTSDEIHHETTREIFRDLYDKGYFNKKTEKQSFCESCNKFLADRFVEGTCPHCGYEDARGDQCDNCGKLLNPTELIDPKCKTCSSTPIQKETEHLYFKLDKLQPKLDEWFNKTSKNWTHNAKTITKNWLNQGLTERAITRDLKWGIKVPQDVIENKVFYVWFDAPLGYISITKQNREDWKDWWTNKDVKLYQFMAKDNVPFHSIIFPATLMAYNEGKEEEFNLVDKLCSVEYLNYETGKFSKSRNQGVFGNDAMKLGLSSDLWRYYLVSMRPETADTSFSWDMFLEKVNNELVANVGNYINRVLTFLKKNFDGEIIDYNRKEFEELDLELAREIEQVKLFYDKTEFREAIKHILRFSKRLNQFFNSVEPWNLIKTDEKKTHEYLSYMVKTIAQLGVLLAPITPNAFNKIKKILQKDDFYFENINNIHFESGHKIGRPKILFKKIDPKLIETFKEKFKGKKDEDTVDKKNIIKNFNLRVGLISKVSDHPDADKIYKFDVDFGDDKRQILAGLKAYYSKEDLEGKKILFITNLPARKIRGLESQGMTIAAEDDEKNVSILEFDAKKGSYVSFENGVCNYGKTIKADHFFNSKLRIENGKIMYKNKILTVNDENPKSRVRNGFLG